MSVDLATATAATFQPFLGQTFSIELAPGDVVDATLVEVDEGTRIPPGGVRMPFSALFQTTRAPQPMQGTYRLSHPTLGTLEVFMSAIQPNATGQRYQLVFN